MKKKLASLLVLALVFTMLVPAFAFAAVPSDVTDATQKDAIAKLMALGVVKGYEDGSIKPQGEITRAEFTKTLVEAAGYGKTAELLKGTNTKFKDVPGTHWASGHIAVAASKGFVKGVNAQQTLFAPEANVTYAEAITMTLRVLGYKEEGLIGTWPTNYIIQANELGLLSNINFNANAKATRGDVFVVIANALEKELVTYNKDKMKFEGTGELLINDAFATSFTTAVVTAAKLDKDGKVSLNGALKETSDLVIEGGKDLKSLLGHNVDYLTVGGKVVYIRDAQKASEVVTAKYTGSNVTSVTYNTYFTFENVSGTFYPTVDSNNNVTAKFYVNDVEVEASKFSLANGKNVTAFLKTENGVTKVRAFLVSAYDQSNLVIKSLTPGYKSTTVAFETYGSTPVKIVESTVITLNGKAATVADLAKGDVVSYKLDPTKTDGTVIAVDAVRNAVTGKVTYNNTTLGKATINGTTYNYVSGVNLAVGSEYTVYLNADGTIVFAKAVNAATSTVIFSKYDSYAVLEGNVVKTVYDLVGVNTDGTAVTLRLDSASVVNNTYEKGDVVTYSLTNGKVTDIDGYVDVSALDAYEIASDGISTTYNKLTFDKKNGVSDSSSIYVSGSTVFVDITDTTPKVIKLADLKDTYTVKYYVSSGVVEYVFVTSKPAAAAQTTVGVFEGLESKLDEATNTVVTVAKVFVGTEWKEFAVEGSAFNAVPAGTLVKLVDSNQNGKYEGVAALDSNKAKQITAAGSASFTVDGKTYRVSANTKFYLVVTDSNGNYVSVDATVYATLQSYAGAPADTVNVSVVADANDTAFADSVVIYVKQ